MKNQGRDRERGKLWHPGGKFLRMEHPLPVLRLGLISFQYGSVGRMPYAFS